MLKLCRNAFGEVRLSSNAGEINFNYVQVLHAIQEKEDLTLANSLSGLHVNFRKKEMNVRLAAQTLSSSVADAIDFLRASGNSSFVGSEATTQFLRVFDRIFDLMNSRDLFGKGYKSPMTLNNRNYWENVFLNTEKYI